MSDLAKLQKELESLRRHENELESKLKAAKAAQFSALPKSVGLSTVDELIKELVAYSSPSMKARFRVLGAKAQQPPKLNSKRVAASDGRQRKRAKITDQTRAKVKEMVESGKTGAEIAKAVKISLPSVQNIKKALGLVGRRKK